MLYWEDVLDLADVVLAAGAYCLIVDSDMMTMRWSLWRRPLAVAKPLSLLMKLWNLNEVEEATVATNQPDLAVSCLHCPTACMPRPPV